MLNNAWPGMIWHLYDYYLRPGGSYFGTKKACEPLHVQYAYDDGSVVVVNSTLDAFPGVKITARVVDLDGREASSRTETLDVVPDGTQKVFALPAPAGRTPTYFVSLTLADHDGSVRSRNDYWLSTKPEALAWSRSEWYYTPVSRYADLTALNRLPAVDVTATAKVEATGEKGHAHVTLENPSKAIAFFVHLAVRKGAEGEEILPVLWEDNYVTLMPGERREVGASWESTDAAGATPVVAVDGWNVAPRLAAAAP
jgi:exo-1,4-beta-D-glucosaminidase